ncbi:hypothetical protein QR680_003094 [Steinernema hermaphroditum]|uniref:Uncharacterized protein n=1 Tax=Steinernema hermaphroditum TaxID=289476 RepID=A0AA39LJ24_9BILA|nr:hypothetical protein QR680_003094 [Steinernema hermaphroditum]
MSSSGTYSSDYYNSFPSTSSSEQQKDRRAVNSWAESSIDSYFRDEGYFSQGGFNTCDSRRTSVSFANFPNDDALDEVEGHRPYFNKFTTIIKDIIDNARNVRLPRYSSADSLNSLDPCAPRIPGRYYGREYYSSDSYPEHEKRVDYYCSGSGSSSRQTDDSECFDGAEILRPQIRSKRISINEPPVTAFFQHNISSEQMRVRKVQSLREAQPKSILKKSSVKSEGHNSIWKDNEHHVYEVIPEQFFRYGEPRPDPRPPLPERPIMWPMVIFPPNPMFQPRSRHAYHRRDVAVIVD